MNSLPYSLQDKVLLKPAARPIYRTSINVAVILVCLTILGSCSNIQ